MAKKVITRHSTVGFGYTSTAENDEHGKLRVCETTKPIHTGTISQVQKAIESDRTLHSFQGGTYYSRAWFVKVAGKWYKINTSESRSSLYLPLDLLEAHPDNEKKYFLDSVTVDVYE